jgi:hypothetical protein
MEKTKKNFDVMEWLRGVRDEDYRRWGHLPTDEYVRKISEEGENSELAKRLNEKARRGGKKH